MNWNECVFIASDSMKLHEESSALENPYGTEWMRERRTTRRRKTFSVECCYVGMEATAHFSPWRSNNVSCTFFLTVSRHWKSPLSGFNHYCTIFFSFLPAHKSCQAAAVARGQSHLLKWRNVNDSPVVIDPRQLGKATCIRQFRANKLLARNIRRFMTIRECSVLAQEHKSQL